MSYLNIKTCRGVEKYLFELTSVQAQVHRTDRYLVINHVHKGQLTSTKVGLPGGVLYCLQDTDLAPVVQAMRSQCTP